MVERSHPCRYDTGDAAGVSRPRTRGNSHSLDQSYQFSVSARAHAAIQESGSGLAGPETMIPRVMGRCTASNIDRPRVLRRGEERQGRALSGAVKAVYVSDPERACWANKWASLLSSEESREPVTL